MCASDSRDGGGRQKQQPRAFGTDDAFGSEAFMAGQILENNDIARPECGCQLGVNVGM